MRFYRKQASMKPAKPKMQTLSEFLGAKNLPSAGNLPWVHSTSATNLFKVIEDEKLLALNCNVFKGETRLPRCYSPSHCFRYDGPGPSCGMLSGKQGVDAMTVENPNVKSIWTTIEVDKDGVETVLVVETDLELNAADPAFDVAKVDALIEAAMNSFAASGGTIDRVHLVPIR
jgi:hypothetical protein